MGSSPWGGGGKASPALENDTVPVLWRRQSEVLGGLGKQKEKEERVVFQRQESLHLSFKTEPPRSMAKLAL